MLFMQPVFCLRTAAEAFHLLYGEPKRIIQRVTQKKKKEEREKEKAAGSLEL